MSLEGTICLTGKLICVSNDQRERVISYLPTHIALTRAEKGCLAFSVTQDPDDPMVWNVYERFASQVAFDAHQKRTQASEWGHATAGIERAYTITRH